MFANPSWEENLCCQIGVIKSHARKLDTETLRLPWLASRCVASGYNPENVRLVKNGTSIRHTLVRDHIDDRNLATHYRTIVLYRLFADSRLHFTFRRGHSVARPREFDPTIALHEAMELFWRRGYADTSMRDLSDHTGVSHAGLYATFGDKRALYKKALDRYDNTIGNMVSSGLEAQDAGRSEVEGFFDFFVNAITSGNFRNGCFMCNTMIEFGDQSDDILRKARKNIRRLIEAFEHALTNAVERGEVRADLDPHHAAKFFVVTFQGIAVLARARFQSDYVKQTVDIALRELD